MSSINVKFRASTVAGREGSIYYQIVHERKVRQISTVYHVFPEEWDDSRSMVRTTRSSARKAAILLIRERIRRDVDRLARIDRRLDAEGVSYTADDVVEEFHRYATDCSLFNFMENLVAKFKQKGRLRTSETYAAAMNSFRKFLDDRVWSGRLPGDRDIMLDSITPEIMEAYEDWHRMRGNTPNTISFYTRILRAVYNRAVDAEIIDNRNPFRHVYTGIDKTVKRAIPLFLL